MTLLAKSLALVAALAASAGLARTDPQAGRRPDAGSAQAGPAKPGASSVQNCPMMNGQRMMNGQAMGAHMQNGHMLDKDGKPIAGGMMGPNGMMCVPPAATETQPGKAAPRANP